VNNDYKFITVVKQDFAVVEQVKWTGKVTGKQLQRTRRKKFFPKKLSTGGEVVALRKIFFPEKNFR
jgi:hypothetical protein